AQVTSSALAAGPHSIIASYNGDANSQASTSLPLTQSIINPPSATTADLAILELESDRRVEPRDLLTYGIAVVNLGSDTANAVNLRDALPAGVTFVAARTSAGTCTTPAVGQTGTVSCNLAALARFGIWTLRITVRVTAQPGSTLSNTVTVASSTPDPRLVNNSATVNTKVTRD
ncbi:MAG TPA: DUF11 domain-containing protein, partial [Terriglobales bacterium]|nr:DUF11 domain-containing protein [Terriglobales bacterium]